MERVAVYIRWSTEEQGDGTTLAVQLEACRLFVQSQGWTFREDLVFVDEGYSGGSLARPGLERLRRAVAAGQVQCVVVYKLDRLSRSVLDTVKLVLEEWDGLCTLRSAREPIDTSSPTGAVFFYMLASYAEWERSVIRERTLSGKIKRAQEGKNPGFTPPFGFARGAGPGDLVIEEDEAAVVRRMFREYAAGRGVRTIAAGLNAEGLRPRRGGLWRPDAVARMVANPVYMGVLRYGVTAAAAAAGGAGRRPGAGRGRRALPEPRYAAVAGAVPAIVSAEEFERAGRVRASKAATPGPRARGGAFLLSGIARCGCGAALRGDGRQGGAYRYYRCSAGCAGGVVGAGALERAVVELLAPGIRRLAGETCEQEAERERQRLAAEEALARRRLARLAGARARLTADYQAGDLPARLYAANMAQLDQEEAALLTRRPLSAEPPAVEGDPWTALSAEEQKQLLRHLLTRCQVSLGPEGIAVDICLCQP
ncbi:MAG TPA: recombinase family protein [Symbiobacteriaceae bacterium]|nr:recombinase family protein [Symbiobacteriaceae bacterium]